MQTAHNVFPAKGVPGQLADIKDGNDIITCIAHEDLQAGRFVELVSSGDDAEGPPHIQLCQQADTGTYTTVIGVVVRDAQRENNVWPANTAQGILAGSRVSVLRRGRIFVERDTADTAAVSRFSSFNIMHSSTNSAKRGMVTRASTATTNGAEISSFTLGQIWQDASADSGGASNAGVALIEVYVK